MPDIARLLIALLLLGAAVPAWTQERTTLRAADIEAGDAMELRHAILPPLMAEEVIAGRKARQFAAGPNYWFGYDSAPVTLRWLPSEFCARYQIAAQLRPSPVNSFDDSEAEADRLLFVESVERTVMVAMAVDASEDGGNCEDVQGYIAYEDYDGKKLLEGYRQLVSLIRAARDNARLPQRFECEIEGWDDDVRGCGDKRQTLASLPMDRLFSIELDDDPDEDEFAGYEASFGPDEDGLSWRVVWTPASEKGVARLEMQKSGVIYH